MVGADSGRSQVMSWSRSEKIVYLHELEDTVWHKVEKKLEAADKNSPQPTVFCRIPMCVGFEKNSNGCDTLMTSSPPNKETFRKLPIKSNAAYVCSGEQLYYINKVNNLCIEIKLDLDKLKQFKIRMDPAKERTLSENELKEITLITGHNHLNINVDKFKALILGIQRKNYKYAIYLAPPKNPEEAKTSIKEWMIENIEIIPLIKNNFFIINEWRDSVNWKKANFRYNDLWVRSEKLSGLWQAEIRRNKAIEELLKVDLQNFKPEELQLLADSKDMFCRYFKENKISIDRKKKNKNSSTNPQLFSQLTDEEIYYCILREGHIIFSKLKEKLNEDIEDTLQRTNFAKFSAEEIAKHIKEETTDYLSWKQDLDDDSKLANNEINTVIYGHKIFESAKIVANNFSPLLNYARETPIHVIPNTTIIQLSDSKEAIENQSMEVDVQIRNVMESQPMQVEFVENNGRNPELENYPHKDAISKFFSSAQDEALKNLQNPVYAALFFKTLANEHQHPSNEPPNKKKISPQPSPPQYNMHRMFGTSSTSRSTSPDRNNLYNVEKTNQGANPFPPR